MDKRFIVADIQAAMRARNFPTISLWNRLEARPVVDDRAPMAVGRVRLEAKVERRAIPLQLGSTPMAQAHRGHQR